MTKSKMSVAVCKSIYTALLLTGDTVSAERAALQAVSVLDPEHVTVEALLVKTIELSVLSVNSNESSSESVGSWPGLPPELKRVLKMRAALRHCFVLRVLVGFSTEVCARLLQLDQSQVAARSSAAMNWLAVRKQKDDVRKELHPEVTAVRVARRAGGREPLPVASITPLRRVARTT